MGIEQRVISACSSARLSVDRYPHPPSGDGSYGGLLLAWLLLLSPVAHADDSDPVTFRAGVRFLTPNSAEVTWECSVAGESAVAYGPTRKLGRLVNAPTSGNYHRVVLTDLQPGQTYFYRLGVKHDGWRQLSPIYELDGRMNYSPPQVADIDQPPAGIDAVVDALNQPGGYAVVLADASPLRWARALAARTSMTVIIACEDPDEVESHRRSLYADGIYGIRLSVRPLALVPDKIANVVLCDAKYLDRAAQLASPTGTFVSVDQPPKSDQWSWDSLDEQVWIGRFRERRELTEWGHQYGSPANGSYVGETLGGIDNTDQLEIRWLGRPGADFGIDRNPRMPAPLAVGGRLFHQGMNRMIALDAFNGAVLWSLEIPDLRRVNIPRDSGNWCADDQHVYAVTKDCLWRIDAATGVMVETVRLPESVNEQADWGYVAVTADSLIGTAVKAGSAYEKFWAKASWYDGQGDAATAKVCGNAIFAIDKRYGTVRWSRPVDAVVQSTIAISGERMFYVEVENDELSNNDSGKLKNKEIWPSASVVCLDLESGAELWKQEVPEQADNQVVAFGIAGDGQYIFESSANDQFHFASFDAATGKRKWSAESKWPSDNHGAHMQHAVLMNGKLFVQPSILDVETGEILATDTLGKRRGCATPIGAGGSIIYRGGSGPVSLWSLAENKASRLTRLRPSCWLSTIPAQGMLFSPDAGGGCSFGGWMECSIGFAPASEEN